VRRYQKTTTIRGFKITAAIRGDEPNYNHFVAGSGADRVNVIGLYLDEIEESARRGWSPEGDLGYAFFDENGSLQWMSTEDFEECFEEEKG